MVFKSSNIKFQSSKSLEVNQTGLRDCQQHTHTWVLPPKLISKIISAFPLCRLFMTLLCYSLTGENILHSSSIKIISSTYSFKKSFKFNCVSRLS